MFGGRLAFWTKGYIFMKCMIVIRDGSHSFKSILIESDELDSYQILASDSTVGTKCLLQLQAGLDTGCFC